MTFPLDNFGPDDLDELIKEMEFVHGKDKAKRILVQFEGEAEKHRNLCDLHEKSKRC
jgi:hypothetical protein